MSELAPLVGEETTAEEERKTSYLELFFDLVFVFAFTQVTSLILEDTSPQGFARAALVLAMVWWAWSAYAWMTNAIDVENSVTRLIMFAAMAAGFFMALAVPDAFQDEAALVSRVAALVLGAHRSGTSVTAGILAHLGFALPRTLMPADSWNAEGYFESSRLHLFHDRLLHAAGTSWDSYTRVSPEWLASDAARSISGQVIPIDGDMQRA